MTRFLSLLLSFFILTVLHSQTHVSDCLKQSNSFYQIRDIAALADGGSVMLKIRHDVSKSAVIIEKRNANYKLTDKRQIVLRGDFINFFTYDFKDAKLIVLEDYVYVFMCERDDSIYKLHAISLYLSDLEDVIPHKIVSKMNDARLYNSNVRSPFDGYFLFSTDEYSRILITGVESRSDVFVKKNSKSKHEVSVFRKYMNCEFEEIWGNQKTKSYYSEYEICDQITKNRRVYELRVNSKLKSYTYNFDLFTVDLNTGLQELLMTFSPEFNGEVGELRFREIDNRFFLVGSYYVNSHKTSSGYFISELNETLTDVKTTVNHDFSSSETSSITSASQKKINKLKGSEKAIYPGHFIIDQLILKGNEYSLVGLFINKKSSHHLRHQYLEFFDGRDRNISSAQSLSGGTLGVFKGLLNTGQNASRIVKRDFKLPQAFMRTSLSKNEVLFNYGKGKKIKPDSDLDIYSLSLYDLNKDLTKKSGYVGCLTQKEQKQFLQLKTINSGCVRFTYLSP